MKSSNVDSMWPVSLRVTSVMSLPVHYCLVLTYSKGHHHSCLGLDGTNTCWHILIQSKYKQVMHRRGGYNMYIMYKHKTYRYVF